MPRRKKALHPESIPTLYVTVKLDHLSGKVTIDSDEPTSLNINNEVANNMMRYYKGNAGQASYKLIIEGMTIANIVDESKGKYAIYKAPLTYWETLISLSDLLANCDSTLSFMLGKKTTWYKEKKTVSITRKIKAT